MNTFKHVVLMKCDSPNLNGHTYSSEMMKKEIDRINKSYNKELLGCVSVNDESPNQFNAFDLGNLSHKITNISLDGDTIFGDITILGTPKGNTLNHIIDTMTNKCKGVSIASKPIGYGSIDESGNVNDYHLQRFDICASGESAWKENIIYLNKEINKQES